MLLRSGMIRSILSCGLLGLCVAQAGVNINMYNGGAEGSCAGNKGTVAPSDKPDLTARDVNCDTSHMTLYVHADYPPFDVIKNNSGRLSMGGMINDLFHAMCHETQAWKGVTCAMIRDEWSNIWRNKGMLGYPGVGMMDHWYDLAYAFITEARSLSLGFTHKINQNPGNNFLTLKANGGGTFPSDGEGWKIGTLCGFGDVAKVWQHYPKATFACDPPSSSCSSGFNCGDVIADLLITMNKLSGKWGIWMQDYDAAIVMDKYPDTYASHDDAKSLHIANPLETHLALAYDVKKPCKGAMVNKALKELANNGVGKRICDSYKGTGVSCDMDHWTG